MEVKTMTINNIPNYAWEHQYIVYRTDDEGAHWFYGAYDTFERAFEVATEIGGDAILTEYIQ